MSHNTYIIIVTYNAMPWLKKCLESIDFTAYKVVVVDNASQDETVRIIEQDYPHIKLFKETHNLGFGQANNKGISYALQQGAEQVFLLNQDAYLIDDALERLINLQQQNPNYGILSPIHTNANQTKLDRNFSNYVRFDNNPFFYADHVLGKSLQPIYEVPFVNAAGWLISKSCLMAVGGFDPLFFHYGEDDNYCQRARYHGFQIGVSSNTFMIHDREDRHEEPIEPFSNVFYVRKARRFKVIYANILTEDIKNFDCEVKKLKTQILKLVLKGKFSQAQAQQSFLKSLDQLKQDIKSSRQLNIQKGPHYLDV